MEPLALLLDHLVLTVKNVETTAAWYERVLGMRRMDWRDSSGVTRTSLFWRESNGSWRKMNLHESGKEIAPHASNPVAGGADLCFISGQKVHVIEARLAECGVGVELGPVARSGATGPLNSVYVRDPDGNLIEIAEQHGAEWGHIAEWEDSLRK